MKTFESQLARETARWVGEKIINEDQKNRILSLYPSAPAGMSRLTFILGMIGGTFVLAGVFLWISANWQQIGDWTKIIGLLGLLGGVHAAGYHLKIQPGKYPKTGEVFLMMGCVLFLAGIALVSQIFHLNDRPATGVFVWWLGIVAVPFLTQSRGAQFVSIVAGLTWLGMEFATEGSLLALETPGSRYDEMRFLQFLALFTGLGLALFLSGMALRHGAFEEFAGAHEKWGMLIVHVALYVLGFSRHFHHGTERLFSFVNPFAATLVFGLLAVTACWAWRKRAPGLIQLAPWFAACLAPMVMVLGGWKFSGDQWTWSVLAWLSLFCLDLALIRIGVTSGREFWVNLGVGMIALNVITRYFDLFGTMMEGAVFFLTTGALILGGGIFLERKRRHLLASMRKEIA